MRQLIEDINFERGFHLQSPDPSKFDRKVEKDLIWDNRKEKPIWWMAQWWTPFDFAKASPKLSDSKIEMANETRRYYLNRLNGAFEMELNSALEYKALHKNVRKTPNDPWSHFLIEQDFPKPAKIQDISHVVARVNFRIKKAVLSHKEKFDPKLHAAQLLWYLTVSEKPSPYNPKDSNFIWFGLPLYDSRFANIESNIFLDHGNSGSTNRLIYNLSSEQIFGKDIDILLNVTYKINLDVYPFITKAIKHALESGIFKDPQSLYINYMNFGLELPGSYDFEVAINGLSLEADDDN